MARCLSSLRSEVGSEPDPVSAYSIKIGNSMKSLVLSLIVVTGLCGCATTSGGTNDLGLFNGVPTPALAMYAAQISFAEDRCVSDGLTTDVNGAAQLLKYFNRGIRLSVYMKKDTEFVNNFNRFVANYRLVWDSSGRKSKEIFCEGFSDEIITRNKHWFQWQMPLNYFRYTFSPPSERSLRIARRIAITATIAGGVAGTAAQVSSGEDAISSAKKGNISTSNQQMAMSRNYGQVTTGIVGVGQGALGSVRDRPLISVFDSDGSDGQRHVVRCPVVDHFYSYSAPVHSDIWITYQRVSMICREPTAEESSQNRG